jgi:hypothetical protein
MKNVSKMLAMVGVVSVLMVACGEDTPKVSVQQLDDSMGIVRDNLLFNAQLYKMTDPRLEGFKAVPNGDSTMSNKCPQGDGWGTITMVNTDTGKQTKLKCSTYSKNVSCQLEKEFKYVSDEGHCASLDKVPYPIPKIAN